MKISKRHMAGAVGIAAAIGGIVWLVPARSIRREPHLQAPAHLPALARGLLKQRMARHAEAMLDITWRTLVLDYGGVAEACQPILDEPQLGRVSSESADVLNAELPARFFVLQSELRERTRLLQKVAPERDAGRLADAYGQLFRTCMSCHQIYAEFPPAGGPHGPRAPEHQSADGAAN